MDPEIKQQLLSILDRAKEALEAENQADLLAMLPEVMALAIRIMGKENADLLPMVILP